MRVIASILMTIMLIGLAPGYVTSAPTPISVLNSVEKTLYGELHSGSMIDRIELVERDVYGSIQSGALLTRIDRLQSFLETTNASDTSLILMLNLVEWALAAQITDGQPLIDRLEALETDIIGKPQEEPIAARITEMMMMWWGTTELDIKPVELQEETLVKIRLLTGIDSAENRVNDSIEFRVVEDIIVDGRIVVPAGVVGTGRVTEVESAGGLGRDGKIVIDFESVSALDGTRIGLRVDERATEKNQSMELALGASMAGLVILGPIGLVGGYFVRGREAQIPVGTEFYLEIERKHRVSGIIARPSM